MRPIDREGFNRNRRREADASTIATLTERAAAWRDSLRETSKLRAKLNIAIIDAHQGGHSFRQIREATGLSIAGIQTILMKAGLIT